MATAGRPIGSRKTGGRKKGVPNKKTAAFHEAVQKYAARKHYHPVYAMIRMALSDDPEITHELRFRCHEVVAQYMGSKLKPVDPETGSSEDRVVIRVALSGDTSD